METLSVLVGMIPVLLLWLTAITVAMVRWSVHPLVSTLVLVGGVMEILVSAASMVLPRVLIERGVTAVNMGLYLAPLHLVGMASMAMIITAVFIGRGPENRAPVDPKLIS
jgi:hypothetical protein